MAKVGKIIVFVTLATILFMALAVFSISRTISIDDYKNEIQTLAYEKANIVLRLDGNIGWRLFPRLELVLNDASIASAKTPDKPLAKVKTIRLSVRLLPLLRKTVQIDEILIDGLKLTALRDANGQTNWSGIGEIRPAGTGKKGDMKPSSDASSTTPTASPIKIDITHINFADTSIIYRDAQKDIVYTIDTLNMVTGAIQHGKDTPVSLSANVNSSDFAWHSKINLNTTLRADFEKRIFTLSNLSITGEAQKADGKGKTLPFSITGAINMDRQAQTLSMTPLLLTVATLRLETQLHMRDWESALTYEGKLSISETDLRQVLEKMDMLPTTADNKALTSFSLNADINGNHQNLSIKNLRAQLDATTINGSLTVSGFTQPTIVAHINGNVVNIDDYLPKTKTIPDKTKDGSSTTTTSTNTPVWNDAPILPLDILRRINFDIDTTFDRIVAKGISVEKFVLKIANKNGRTSINTLHGNALGGTFSANAAFDARNDSPQFAVQKNIDNVQLEQFFAHSKKSPPIKGKAMISAKLIGSGNSLKSWIETLDGNGNIHINDGILPGANLEMKLCSAIALLNRKQLTKEHGSRDTVFQRADASFYIKNGIARNSDLVIALPGLKVAGQGVIDLRALTTDYRAEITIEGDQTAMPDPACTVNKRYVGLAFPLHCYGSITSGAEICGMDEKGMAQIALKLAGDKVVGKALEKLDGDNMPLKDALKRLLKR